MDAVLSWQQAYEAGPRMCGRKGYNLARLSRYGFRIPRGGVLPTDGGPQAHAADLELPGPRARDGFYREAGIRPESGDRQMTIRDLQPKQLRVLLLAQLQPNPTPADLDPM